MIVTQALGSLEDRLADSLSFSQWRRAERAKRRRRNRRGLLLLAAVVALLFAYAESSWTRAKPRGHLGQGQVRWGQRGPEAWHWEWHKRGVLIRSLRRQRAGLERQLAAYQPKQEATRQLAGVSGICWACWERVAACESGGLASANTGNGFYGKYQFTYGTGLASGGGRYAPRADLASAAEQTIIAESLRQSSGLGPWPVCGSRY